MVLADDDDRASGPIDPATGRPRRFAYPPSLVVVDGGLPQVNAAQAVLDELGIEEVAVVGRPDDDWGQRVVAVVVPAEPDGPPSLDELRALVAGSLHPFAAPRELIVVDELPKTSLGKVLRNAL